jgi:hypothetical protein
LLPNPENQQLSLSLRPKTAKFENSETAIVRLIRHVGLKFLGAFMSGFNAGVGQSPWHTWTHKKQVLAM